MLALFVARLFPQGVTSQGQLLELPAPTKDEPDYYEILQVLAR